MSHNEVTCRQIGAYTFALKDLIIKQKFEKLIFGFKTRNLNFEIKRSLTLKSKLIHS
jgi:hypothetical protein